MVMSADTSAEPNPTDTLEGATSESVANDGVEPTGDALTTPATNWEKRYKNLESVLTRQGQELGELRKLKDGLSKAVGGTSNQDEGQGINEAFKRDPHGTLKTVLTEFEGAFTKNVGEQINTLLASREERTNYDRVMGQMYPDIKNPESPLFKKTVEIAGNMIRRHPTLKDSPDIYFVAASSAHSLLSQEQKEPGKPSSVKKPKEPIPPSGGRQAGGEKRTPVLADDELVALRNSGGNTDRLADLLVKRAERRRE